MLKPPEIPAWRGPSRRLSHRGDRKRTRPGPTAASRRTTSMGEPTQDLARFAATLGYDGVPERVRTHCKNVLLDTIACAVAGHQGEETGQIAALAGGLAQSSEASVIGGDRLSLAGATLLNGYLVTAVTMCDIHRSTLTHVTPEVVPAALATARRAEICSPRSRPASRSRHGSASAPTIRRCGRAAGTARACSGPSAPPPRSVACAASTPTRWRRRSASPAARRRARSRR